METLKNFAVPLVALVLLLVWFFVIRPMLAEAPADLAPAAEPTKPAEHSP
ncbi:hypothetical protein [Enhygromyxa salina]|uniref:Membrane protein insertase YidC n=1 Tax=Enhygromyxa salina TaxID=215803 RepID=A0A2S9YXL1_9BACT|nr:hypothetical protein [Enhygromyxa salina]PRQ09833.1 hypothetical protein ENSA7_03830 [Enhygromyxa salina]